MLALPTDLVQFIVCCVMHPAAISGMSEASDSRSSELLAVGLSNGSVQIWDPCPAALAILNACHVGPGNSLPQGACTGVRFKI